MRDLFTAIYTQFSTTPHSSFYNAIGGRMYLQEAPEKTAYPYAVYSLTVNSYDHSFTSHAEEALIDFELYSDSTGGATEIVGLYEKLKEVYDDPSFAMSNGWKLVRFKRENAELSRLIDAIPNKPVWQYAVTYTVMARKPKTT